MAGKFTTSLGFLIILAIAAYFIVLGLQGIDNYNSLPSQFGKKVNEFLGRSGSPVTLIIAIAELAAGVALVLSLFLPGLGSTLSFAAIIVWLARIVYTSFIDRLSTAGETIHFIPDFKSWLAMLLVDVIILLALLNSKPSRR